MLKLLFIFALSFARFQFSSSYKGIKPSFSRRPIFRQSFPHELRSAVSVNTLDGFMHELRDRNEKKDTVRNIFCNVELNCGGMEAVGFDMDFTLAQYKKSFDLLAFEEAKEKLVHLFSYPENVLDFPFRSELASRGLIIDKRRGNILKLDRHRYVRQALHGMSELVDRRIYNEQVEKLMGAHYVSIDTLFSVIDTILFMYLVDYHDRFPDRIGKSYEQIYSDIRTAVDLCHRDGAIKDTVMKDAAKYIEVDHDLVPMLKQLKSSGKKIFLLTNSLWEYTNTVMNFLVNSSEGNEGGEWQNLFDVVIVGGNKPVFLQQDRLSLFSVDTKTGLIRNVECPECLEGDTSEVGRVFQGGSWQDLHRLLNVSCGDRILYVGDHMYADILRSKRTLGWRTCLIIPELEHELKTAQEETELYSKIVELRKLQYDLDDCVDNLRSSKLRIEDRGDSEKNISQIESEIELALKKSEETKQLLKNATKEYDAKFNPHWGQLFNAGHQHSRFAKQALDYACLYTSRASNLRFCSPHRSFRPIQDLHPADTFLYFRKFADLQ